MSLSALRQHFALNSRCKDYQSHSSKVHSVDWNCDGRRLASGSFDKTVSVFQLEKDRLSKEHTFKGHSDSVDQLTWHPFSADLLATASLDKSVRVWDARANKSMASIGTKGENINICWSPDGHTIAVGNKEDLVTFIDTRTLRMRKEQPFKFEVNEISWNNDNDLFFLTSGQGHVHILSYPSLEPQCVLNAHPATCICIEFDPTGKYFAVGSADAMVSLWDASHLVCIRTISRLDWPARTISFSHDGQLLASASEDLMIDISYVETGEKVTDIPTESPTFTVAFHPKRYLLAFACDDKDAYNRDRDAGTVKLFGFAND
ncbi:THO complex subunit 3-like protein [Leptotrombidium deliense]|uniref:THO complex subunit 3-like protein n=1 Tax=Leptotrombidium deliense TaxID=299467 RepID=A0A443SSN0_9ACAR|nr:THO complex subunit 3-like protein [Leptotrombidium deliense]